MSGGIPYILTVHLSSNQIVIHETEHFLTSVCTGVPSKFPLDQVRTCCFITGICCHYRLSDELLDGMVGGSVLLLRRYL